MLNPRTKGARGEREIANVLNEIVERAMADVGFPEGEIAKVMPVVQRNSNQSAVGGADLSGTYGMAIEIKRQEQLSVETWWRQCVKSAEKINELPVLIYRKNRQKWRVRTYAALPTRLGLPESDASAWPVVEFDFNDFCRWFYRWVYRWVYRSYPPETARERTIKKEAE